MDPNLSPALARRLAAYSATAGVALLLPPSADAQGAPTPGDPDRAITDSQVVYHDFDPDITECGEYHLYFDLDDDGRADLDLFQAYAIYHCLRSTVRHHTFALTLKPPQGAPSENRIAGYSPPGYAAFASRLSSGDLIGPDRGFVARGLLAWAYCPGPPYLGLFVGEEGYAGFRFVGGDGQLRYGWMRLAVSECPMYPTIYEYAYEAAADTPIAAGARSAALLDGSVNQTVFPATGGTLAYTFTVVNTTGEPQPLDLWLDASGPEAILRHLGSGTLPAGATATRTVRVRVPAGVPSGTYDVRFRLGNYQNLRFITFERYAVTKEAGAGVAAGGGEAFVAEPVEGDLFAGASAAEAILGTHTLSAPVPNPSTGQTSLTLAVAEAQHVAVTVHDALGRGVAVLHDGPLAAGQEHRLVFDGSGLPAGAYAVRAVGEAFSDVRVLTLTR